MWKLQNIYTSNIQKKQNPQHGGISQGIKSIQDFEELCWAHQLTFGCCWGQHANLKALRLHNFNVIVNLNEACYRGLPEGAIIHKLQRLKTLLNAFYPPSIPFWSDLDKPNKPQNILPGGAATSQLPCSTQRMYVSSGRAPTLKIINHPYLGPTSLNSWTTDVKRAWTLQKIG